MSFVRAGRAKKTAQPGEVNPREKELARGIVDLDPFSGVEKKTASKLFFVG